MGRDTRNLGVPPPPEPAPVRYMGRLRLDIGHSEVDYGEKRASFLPGRCRTSCQAFQRSKDGYGLAVGGERARDWDPCHRRPPSAFSLDDSEYHGRLCLQKRPRITQGQLRSTGPAVDLRGNPSSGRSGRRSHIFIRRTPLGHPMGENGEPRLARARTTGLQFARGKLVGCASCWATHHRAKVFSTSHVIRQIASEDHRRDCLAYRA